MIDEMNEALDALTSDERMIQNTAKMIRKLFNELINEGFTEEQAAIIVANYRETK